MPTKQEILQEQIRRERERRAAGGTAAPAARPSFRDATIQGGRQSENVTDLSTNQAGLEVKEGDPLLSASPLPSKSELRSLPQVIDDLMLQFGEGYTYNMGNKLSGGTEADVNAARDRTGWAGTAAEFGGAVTSPSIAARVPALAIKGGKTLAHGIGGAAEAALSAYGQGKDWGEIGSEALKGGGISGVASKLSEPVMNWWQRRKNTKNQTYKTNEDLTKGRKEEYKKLDDSKVVFRNADLRKLQAQLRNINTVPGTEDYVRTEALLKRFEQANAGRNLTPSEMDTLISEAGRKLKANVDKTIGQDVTNAMSEFSKSSPVYKIDIDPVTGRKSYKQDASMEETRRKARDLFARESRLGKTVQAERDAQRLHRSGRFNPFGASLESARVKQYEKLGGQIEKGSKKGGTGTSPFLPAEQQAVNQLGAGTFRRNLGGSAEHLAPSGSLLGAASPLLPIGAAFLNPAGAAGLAVPGVAEVLYRSGQSATNREIRELQALIRDPTGKGIKADPAKVEEARKRLAQLTSKAYRSGALPGDQER